MDDPQLHALAQRYCDALYHCDGTTLSELLHPLAIYAGNPGGELTVLTRDAYLARVAVRTPPASRGEPRDERVLKVERVGEHIAVLQLACAFGDQRYHDVLGLVRSAGHWRIASKLFHAEPRRWPTT